MIQWYKNWTFLTNGVNALMVKPVYKCEEYKSGVTFKTTTKLTFNCDSSG